MLKVLGLGLINPDKERIKKYEQMGLGLVLEYQEQVGRWKK